MSERVARAGAIGRPPAKFVTGSILRHILVMTGTGAVGLMAIFVGDLANIVFLSMLNDVEVVAAVGFASSLVFLAVAAGIGLSIAVTASVAPAIGAGRRTDARRLATHGLIFSLTVATILAIVILALLPTLLTLLGATGRTHALAVGYGRMVIAAMPFLAIAMSCAAILRSLGDATRAMHITLSGAIVAVVLDPLLIFGAGLGLDGAALATIAARLMAASVGLYGALRVHDALGPVDWERLGADTAAIFAVALPAVVTNLATPFANAWMTAAMSSHGNDAVAGWTVIGRLYPVAFGAIFALSGSIGPIIGQNFGARDGARLEETLVKAVAVTAAFTLVAWLLLALAADGIVTLFDARGEAAELILVFCRLVAPLFFFLGLLFVSNAAFNTLGRPRLAAALNWGRATLGTVPLVWLGGAVAGAAGALAGFMASGIVFGVIAVFLCLRLVRALAADWRAHTDC
ncbi:MAG: MATE family efflux transporter [Hyphomicrobiaceae bacterium]